MRLLTTWCLLLFSTPLFAQTYRQVDVCFVLDTTGSMSATINTAKEKIWFIANEIARSNTRPALRLCLVAYRDREDDYVTQLTPLSSNIDAIAKQLKELEADGGGDAPEAVHQALFETVRDAGWNAADDTLKVIFLIGDAPPKIYPDEPQYPEIAALAAQRQVVINPVLIGSDANARSSFESIQGGAAGALLQMSEPQAQVPPTTPMDQDLIALSSRLNASLVLYGDPQQRDQLNEQTLQLKSLSDSKRIERLAFGQAAGRVLHQWGDLVQDIGDGELTLGDVDPQMLPEQLRSMSQQELARSLGEIQAERIQLQALIGQLLEQRRQLMEQQITHDSFEYQLSQVLLRQL